MRIYDYILWKCCERRLHDVLSVKGFVRFYLTLSQRVLRIMAMTNGAFPSLSSNQQEPTSLNIHFQWLYNLRYPRGKSNFMGYHMTFSSEMNEIKPFLAQTKV